MSIRFNGLTLHLSMILGLILLLLGVMLHPFLPGSHDRLALTLSWMVQTLGVLGLPPALIGILWLAYEGRKQWRTRRNLPHQFQANRFARASLVAATVPMLGVTGVALGSVGFSLALPVLGLCAFAAITFIPILKRLKHSEKTAFNPTPAYLSLIPVVLSLAQLTLARPLTDFSRNRAMVNSEELIQAIERHREQYGRYPESLLALWPDYSASIVGIAQYHYARRGDTYNLFFEQPRFVFDDLGTREVVVYNNLDQHVILSHASWILTWSPEQAAASQGWYSARQTERAHWKSFSFD